MFKDYLWGWTGSHTPYEVHISFWNSRYSSDYRTVNGRRCRMSADRDDRYISILKK